MPQSDWRQLDWSILTTVALVGPYEPELMCYAHSKGVRLVFGWDPGAFCPGPNGNNWMTKAMNATPEQIRACIPSPNDWLNETLADLWVTESVRYLRSIHVDGAKTFTSWLEICARSLRPFSWPCCSWPFLPLVKTLGLHSSAEFGVLVLRGQASTSTRSTAARTRSPTTARPTSFGS